MAGPYFQKTRWVPFVYQGKTYDLAHLDEYEITVRDTGSVDRRIAVTFDDHCFTRKPDPGDDPALAYPASNRQPGHFCFDRYGHTFDLRNYIEQMTRGEVWNVEDENYALVPVVDHAGTSLFYAIVFSLDRRRGFPPIDLHMRVRTAYPCTDGILTTTFGHVRFRHLVALRVKNDRPRKDYNPRRRMPRM